MRLFIVWFLLTLTLFANQNRVHSIDDLEGITYNKDKSKILGWYKHYPEIYILDAKSEKVLFQYELQSKIMMLHWGRDEYKIYFSAFDTDLVELDIKTKKERAIVSHDSEVWGATFNKEMNRVLTWGCDGKITITNLKSTKTDFIVHHSLNISSVAFSEDETSIILSEGNITTKYKIKKYKRVPKNPHIKKGYENLCG